MGVASGCGEQEAGVASGSGWNLLVWLLGVVVRRYMYIDFLILLIPTPLVSVLFYSSIPTFCSLKKNVFFFIASEASFLVCSMHGFSISGRTSCRKCSKCFYVYLNIRPMRYSAMQL